VACDTQAAFREHFGSLEDESVVTAHAPGRVNLLGGHTDYSGGFVLPATIDRTVCVTLRRRSDQRVRLRSLDFDETADYALAGMEPDALPAWARYVAGVADALGPSGDALPLGFEGIVQGNVPLGAGLSSSAALEVAAAVGLSTLFSLDLGPVEAAKLCQRVEQKYVGVECGIMDQFASRVGRGGHALFLDCRSLEYEHVPLLLKEREAALVVIDSGVRRELASSKYNERRRECEEAARFLQQFDESIESLRDVPASLLDEYGEEMPATLRRRARHVTGENDRVQEGVKALHDGRMEAFGRLVNGSHASLRDDYEVSSAELDALAEAAQQTNGVYGARMTGAGFGGCLVALARQEAVSDLEAGLEQRYQNEFGRSPELHVIEQNVEAASL
jgi:galactokinase